MIRPSNLDRRAACPGSERMEEGLPNEDSAESIEGTNLHHFLAHPELVRRFLPSHLQELLKTADDLDEQLFATVIDNENLLDSDECVTLREVEAHWGDFWGHIDLLRRYPKRNVTIIRDAKFGYIPVPAAEMNLQLRGYACIAPDDVVYVAITQPRAPFHQRITVARYTHRDIEDSKDQIAGIKMASASPEAPLHAGDHCRYCRARAICPELQAAINRGLMPLSTIPAGLSKTALLGRVEARLAQLTDDQLGVMLESFPLINFVYDPLMTEARRRIEAGQLPNYKLGKAMERRKITDSQKAISLLALAGMTREGIMECVNLSLTKLEDKLNGETLRTGMITGAKDAKDFTNKVLAPVLETETGKARVLRK